MNWLQTDFSLMQNKSDKCNYNSNLVSFENIQNLILCVTVSSISQSMYLTKKNIYIQLKIQHGYTKYFISCWSWNLKRVIDFMSREYYIQFVTICGGEYNIYVGENIIFMIRVWGKTDWWTSITRIDNLTSKLNSMTVPVLPSLDLTVNFLFIFYLPQCTLPCFILFFFGFLAIFILLSSGNNSNSIERNS